MRPTAFSFVLVILPTIRLSSYSKPFVLTATKDHVFSAKISLVEADLNTADMQKENLLELKTLPKEGREFRLLDKVICLDPAQSELMHQPLPMIIIGSAGRGKTALILEKMRPTGWRYPLSFLVALSRGKLQKGLSCS